MNILNQLLEEIYNYQTPVSQKFVIGNYYAKSTIDGYVLCSHSSIVKIENNGRVFRLNKTGEYQRCDHKGWQVYCEIYNKIDKQKDIRIEIPIKRKTILLDNNEFDFIELFRPNGQIGTTFYDDIKTDLINEKYFLDYIDDTTLMLHYICPIIKKHEVGLSIDLLAPYKRNRDNNGYFWIDFKRWSKNFDEFYKFKIRYLYIFLLNFKTIDNKRIMNYAESQWSKFLK